ncbi:MAG: DUF1761 domain-containing protein [Candidatus Aenigmarchaeota archaeon]|nr:DUF1761 domain-containing protein [Candidatus Aenigmarchaeota archaeon]
MVVSFSVNLLAVLVAAIASFIIGFLWYGPLFGKSWIKMMGWTPKQTAEARKKGMAKSAVVGFISGLVISFVLANIIKFSGALSLIEGLAIGFLVWIGFVAAIMLGSVLWEGRDIKLYVLNVSCYLVSFLVMSAIFILL